MNNPAELSEILVKNKAEHTLIELIPLMQTVMPSGEHIHSDEWDVIEWYARPGNSQKSILNFAKIENYELRQVTKIYLCEKRLLKKVDGKSLFHELDAMVVLGRALGTRSLSKITNAVFQQAETTLSKTFKNSTAVRRTAYIVTFGKWLNSNFGLRISFSSSSPSLYFHGRKALTDESRETKLVDTRIIVDLLTHAKSRHLIEKDSFYLSVFALLVGTGFRINEVATLPSDCIIIEGEQLGIKYLPEKSTKIGVRWIVKEWREPVKDAIENILKKTKKARETALALRKKPGFDWYAIIKNEIATEYFVSKFCHEWTSNPRNDIFNKEGAWFEKEKRYIDMKGLLDKYKTKSAISKEYGFSRTAIYHLLQSQDAALSGNLPKTNPSSGGKQRKSWTNDSRVLSNLIFFSSVNITEMNYRNCFEIAANIIINARENFQLKGKVFPKPKFNREIEETYKRRFNPVVRSKDGVPLLEIEDTLLVVSKHQLSESQATKHNDITLITKGHVSRWFAGDINSRGKKNITDSCFSRLEIIDPNTGKIAKFTSHDIRHWLTTFFFEGGMDSASVALLFNRNENQNHVYDQTTAKTRLNRLRQAIKDGGAMGHIADTYNNISQYSRLEAISYLEASTIQLNLMPHGGCSLNWGMQACDNHNGCFNGKDGLCKKLNLDLKDSETKIELDRMFNEAKIAIKVIPKISPQYAHYENIQANIKTLLG